MKKNYIAHQCLLEGILKATICRIIAKCENGSSMNQAKGQGRLTKIMTREKLKKLEKMFDRNDRLSKRKATSKFGCTQCYICGGSQRNKKRKRNRKLKISTK